MTLQYTDKELKVLLDTTLWDMYREWMLNSLTLEAQADVWGMSRTGTRMVIESMRLKALSKPTI